MKLLAHTMIVLGLLHAARFVAGHHEPWAGLVSLLVSVDGGVTFAGGVAGAISLHRFYLLLALAWAVLHFHRGENAFITIAVPLGVGIFLGLQLRKHLVKDDSKGAPAHVRPREALPSHHPQPYAGSRAEPGRLPESSASRRARTDG